MKHDIKWDILLRIRTTGWDSSNADMHHYPYEPTDYRVLERLVESGYIGKKNVLVDYGCGKGRVDYFLSHETKCKSIGVEYDERIYNQAMDNMSHAVSKSKVFFYHGTAEEFEPPTTVDRCYFFNPFSTEILQKVIARIKVSYFENPREILLFFYYPSDYYISYLMTDDNLEFYDEIDCTDLFEEYNKRERIMIFKIV
ncbi:MAG: class I SAM-dependent methyltransferase [Lachnospiraceae bacterium]|nr:class I SAM-dependent methyltransferase [Lachnospiraceae bacterium]MBQ9935779.1 class I SAM-dependent methyltransferase [Lachnospiraceae bacterium]